MERKIVTRYGIPNERRQEQVTALPEKNHETHRKLATAFVSQYFMYRACTWLSLSFYHEITHTALQLVMYKYFAPYFNSLCLTSATSCPPRQLVYTVRIQVHEPQATVSHLKVLRLMLLLLLQQVHGFQFLLFFSVSSSSSSFSSSVTCLPQPLSQQTRCTFISQCNMRSLYKTTHPND